MSGLRESQHLKIPLKEIELATKNFQTCIGRGGYGPVYKGELSIYGKITTVAVKRLNEQLGQGLKEFLTEIQLLTGQNHPNLISLLGFCDEGKEKIIVYEYAERGSLDMYLTSSNAGYTLKWLERLRVCVDAARGLDHLHNHVGKHQAIIHRDIKSANILLDENWVAKISDLGLSRLSFAGLDRSAVVSRACGTPGYCEPEYIDTGIVKKESDVYSFGMVLFEVLCGRLCSFRHRDGLLLTGRLAKDYYEKQNLDEIIDPGLREQMSLESMNKFSAIAYGCVQDDRGRRPAIDLVMKELVESLKLQVEYESAKPESSRMEMKLPPDSEDINKEEPFSLLHQGILLDNKEWQIIHKTPYMNDFLDPYIPLEDIKLATNNFGNNHCIGRGRFGKVYKGELLLSCGLTMVAIKRLDSTLGKGYREFWNEIKMHSRYKHENLVSLLGFCDEIGENILVYEYLSNKSLDLYIRSTDLSWNQRLHICIGAARGLQYLHDPKETQQTVLPRNFKSSTILLDQNWNAKIKGFGLSKMVPANQQLWMGTDWLTTASDIYFLGVVFFEVLCGRFYIEINYEDIRQILTQLARQCYEEKKLDTIISSNVREQISQACLERFSTIAYQCVQKDRYERPAISEIVKELEIALQYQVEYEFAKEKEPKRDVVLEFESVA